MTQPQVYDSLIFPIFPCPVLSSIYSLSFSLLTLPNLKGSPGSFSLVLRYISKYFPQSICDSPFIYPCTFCLFVFWKSYDKINHRRCRLSGYYQVTQLCAALKQSSWVQRKSACTDTASDPCRPPQSAPQTDCITVFGMLWIHILPYTDTQKEDFSEQNQSYNIM